METTYTTIIDCTPEQLWSWIEESDKQKQWMKGLLENVPTSDGPTQVGLTFRMTIQEGGRVAEYDGEVTNYDLHRHLGIRLSGAALKGVELTIDYKLQDLGARTRLDYICTADTSRAGFFMRLMMSLFKLFGAMQLRGFMKTLKRLAEAEATQTTVAA